MTITPIPPQPEFDVELDPPDLSAWAAGNTGIPGFTTLASPRPGPHVALLALTHGNEFAGALVLDELLRGSFAPSFGRVTIGFVNQEAFGRFDPLHPTASRFLDEDINRVWDESVLDGPRHSRELARAREIRPIIDTVDVLLDLHSMLWPSEPLMLCGASDKGRTLARGIGTPELVVADKGHASGKRLIDYARFVDPGSEASANLLEAGQHWRSETVENARVAVWGLLRHLGLAPALESTPAQRFYTVTDAIAAATKRFIFLASYHGGDVVEHRNTPIAMDGDTEIRTPYDDCLLVMPSLRPARGHTAVRLARFDG
jgi:predicted deacylase